jgi:hypothetical protein
MNQESSPFAHNRNSYTLPWLLQAYETGMKPQTEITVRKVGLSHQGFPAFDNTPVHYMRPLSGFSTVSLGEADARRPPPSVSRWPKSSSVLGAGACSLHPKVSKA